MTVREFVATKIANINEQAKSERKNYRLVEKMIGDMELPQRLTSIYQWDGRPGLMFNTYNEKDLSTLIKALPPSEWKKSYHVGYVSLIGTAHGIDYKVDFNKTMCELEEVSSTISRVKEGTCKPLPISFKEVEA